MSVQYTSISSHGNWTDDWERRLEIYLYPNDSSFDSKCESGGSVYHGVRTMAEQLIEDGAIDHASIWITYEHPEIKDSGIDKYDKRERFKDWTGNHNIASEGVQLLACDGDAEGAAYSPSTWQDSALLNPRVAIAEANLYVEAERNTASHEALHTIINGNNEGVKSMADHSNVSDIHHDLGSNLTSMGDTTPLASGYGSTHSHHGQCNGYANSYGVFTEELTDCTKGSVAHTVDQISRNL